MPRINSTFTSRVRAPRGDDLLAYLSRRFDYRTRAEWAGLLAQGRLELDGRPARADEIPREGQHLLFHVIDYDEPDVPMDFSILGRTGELAFVHKPAGMPVHRTGRIFFHTLSNLVKERLGDATWAPLNRLDRETSGIVAFARGPEAFRALAPDGAGALWTKVYVAAVRGRLPEAGIGRIDRPLGEVPGDAIRSRMHVHDGGKRSLTLYRTVSERSGCSLVALSPITGRKHQLRAHLAWAGCPVIGDKMYADGGAAYLARLERELDDGDFRLLGAARHQLHACWLRIAPEGGAADEALDLESGCLEHGAFSAADFREWWQGPDGRSFREAAAAERAAWRTGVETGTGEGTRAADRRTRP